MQKNKKQKRIYGIGVDIVEVARMEEKISNDNFAKKLLTSSEYNVYISIETITERARFASKCWAVKEAFVKAMGTGFTGIFNKKDVAYGSSGDARPYIELSNAAELEVIKLNLKTNLSVSDEVSNVVAFVIVERTNY